MNYLLLHGYYLTGTGSNIFVQNSCRELCKQGHNVILVCQEEHYSNFDMVSKAYVKRRASGSFRKVYSNATPYKGDCILYKPYIGELLPVYVFDNYAGFTAKEVAYMPQDEIEEYIHNCVQSINEITLREEVNYIWSQHAILQPVVIARSEAKNKKHICTIHGSALRFSVEKSVLCQKYAIEGLLHADYITFVSSSSRKDFLQYFSSFKIPALDSNPFEPKTRVLFPGVDTTIYHPIDREEDRSLEVKKALLVASVSLEEKSKQKTHPDDPMQNTDMKVIERLLSTLKPTTPLVFFHGKYYWTKGLIPLIASIPLILQKVPLSQFIFTGYGSTPTYLETLICYLQEGRRRLFLEALHHPSLWDGEIDSSSVLYLQSLFHWLEDGSFADRYFSAAKENIQEHVFFTGYLPQDSFCHLLRCADVSIYPSIFPEAFGLVAVESLASGVIPLQSYQTGFIDVIETYRHEFSDIFKDLLLLKMNLSEEFVFTISHNIIHFLQLYQSLSAEQKTKIKERARSIASKHFSWESMIRQYNTLLSSE